MAEPVDVPFTISFGSVSFECRDGQFGTAISEPDTASGTVAAEDIARTRVDWSTSATVAIGGDMLTEAGVVEAVPLEDGSVAVSLRNALVLSESVMPPMVSQNAARIEIVYAAARAAGFPVSNIRIEGLSNLPVEAHWVLAPVRGLRVERAVRVGVVEFVDGRTGREMLQRFSPPLDSQFSDPLAAASTFARVAVVARTLHDAEEEGLVLIDTANAWLAARLRYSWSHTPDGKLQHYERTATRVVVERRDGVGVLAVQGPRRWWRATTVERGTGEIALGNDAPWMEPGIPQNVAAGDRQALLALQRAATAGDPIQRVTALWESVEFYVGRRGTEEQFSPDDIEEIVSRACDGLSDAKLDRVNQLLRGMLNHLRIRDRLERVLSEEGVPVTMEDLRLLFRLKRDRDRSVHGSTAAPEHEEIDCAVAFMSRAITTRWYASTHSLRS